MTQRKDSAWSWFNDGLSNQTPNTKYSRKRVEPPTKWGPGYKNKSKSMRFIFKVYALLMLQGLVITFCALFTWQTPSVV